MEALKLTDIKNVSKDILYARQRTFELCSKPGNPLARPLSQHLPQIHNTSN